MAITTRAGKGSALTHAEMDTNLGYLVPSGAVMAFAMQTAPVGWIECRGQAISRTTYADLFSAIGTTFGAGDGSTSFNLPNLRGEFIRGWDNGRGIDSGRTFGSAQGSANLAHTHGITDPGHAHSYNGGNLKGCLNDSPPDDYANNGGTTESAVTGITIDSSGGTEARQRNIAMMYCIKV